VSWTLAMLASGAGRSPWRILDDNGQPVAWLNDFLDAQAVRNLSPLTLRMYAVQLLHFGRWWNRQYGEWKMPPAAMLAEYVRAQLQEQPPPETTSINARLGMVHRLCRFHFGEQAGWQDTGLRHRYLRRALLGYGPAHLRWSQLRLKQPRPVIEPLTEEQVGRFWDSFHNCRDMALIALMLLNGLRSRETLSLRLEDVNFSEAQLRVSGKGRRQRLLPLPPDTLKLLDLYLRTERPATSSPFLFVCLKGPARGQPMTPAGMRSLFRYHRGRSGVSTANPHRFRHTFGAEAIRAGVSLPALQRLMGHTDIQTTMLYVNLTPADVWREFARAVAARKAPRRKS
jgi:integrase/recombinase XerD